MGHRGWFVALFVWSGLGSAQEPSGRPPPIVVRAIARRALETDSLFVPWRARARGLVTFLAEYGPPGATSTRLIKADQLDVEVYSRGGTGAKQVIRAWRDTTFFPSGMVYHRDHLGIVTDDFGPIIRVGEGDEVSDAIHPLAPNGPAHYRYEVGDTVLVQTGAGTLRLVTVRVRPRRLEGSLVLGTLYIDIDRETLVRSRFTFTPAAYRDPDLEDITVRLERTLVDNRVWLPYRQEIEVRRRSAVVDVPLRGVIRGEWRIGDYELDPPALPDLRLSPPIGGLQRPGGPAVWTAPLAAAIDSGLAPVDRAEVGRVRADAVRLAGGRLLDGLPRFRPAVTRLSDVLRVNRVQGLVLGSGVAWRPRGPIDLVRARLELGTSDGRVTGEIEIGARIAGSRIGLAARRAVVDVGPEPVASGLVGSLAAQESGHDFGDYVMLESVGLAWSTPPARGTTLALGLGREWAWSVPAGAEPARGAYRVNPALGGPARWVGRAALSRDAGVRPERGWSGRAELEVGSPATYVRFFTLGEVAGSLGSGLVRARAWLGVGSAALPVRRSFMLGGRATLPGTPHRAWGGRRAAWIGLEWLGRLPGPAIPLGWLGRTAPEILVGPMIRLGWAGGPLETAPWRPSNGLRPVVGVAVELLDRTIRIEVGRALRDGRGVGLTIDVARSWWPIL